MIDRATEDGMGKKRKNHGKNQELNELRRTSVPHLEQAIETGNGS